MRQSNGSPGVRLVRVDEDREGQRIDNFLSARLKGVPRAAIYRMIRTGQVRINMRRCKASTRLCAGDEVRIPPARTSEQGPAVISARVRAQLKEAVIHQDEHLLVVDKPSGIAVHAGSGLPWGLIDALRREYPGEFLELAHRLDRETSGCLVLARNGTALKRLAEQFRAGAVCKYYLCVMDGRMPQPVIDVDAPLKKEHSGGERRVEVSEAGKPALTRFHLLEEIGDCSYAEVELLTGRTHQIRVHAAHLKQPLAGDGKYAPPAAVERWQRLGLRRLFLHAHRLRLSHPAGDEVEFDAPLPTDLANVLSRLAGRERTP